MAQQPSVGVGVLIIKDNKILFGKRRSNLHHGDGYWGLVGGHLEFNETPEQCALREVAEEVGVSVKNIRLGPFTNDIFPQEGKHYVTLFVIAEYDSGEVELKEPD